MAVYVYSNLERSNEKEDIYYVYLEGSRILKGENPYERVLGSDMLHNDKFSTYFPGIYLISASIQVAGYDDFEGWHEVWTILNIGILFLIGLLIFLDLEKRSSLLLAIFGLIILYFHSYSIIILRINHIDFIAILFLVLSLKVIERKPLLSLVFFGLSLSMKHMAIFAAPLYLFTLRDSIGWRRSFTYCVAGIGLPIVVFSLPFIIWNAQGFFKSILFSATRLSGSHFKTLAASTLVGAEGLIGKLPMLLLFFIIYYLNYTRKIGIRTGVFLILAVFIGFNSVLFVQYLIWPVVGMILMLPELYRAVAPGTSYLRKP
jgi:uncharacterized membrane protein